MTTLGKYELTDHVLVDIDPADAAAHWLRMDCTVRSWLFSTISPELMEIVTTGTPTARSVWLGLEEQFIGNKVERSIIIDAQFRMLVQGDQSISDYCRKMKNMPDALGDLGEPVPDRTLVFQVLRGLNERFSHLGALIKRTRPLPDFRTVRADLQIEEATMASKSSSALVATSAQQRPNAQNSVASSSQQTSKPPSNNNGYGRRKYNRNRGQGGAPGGFWPTSFNPWTRSFQVFGPRPPPQQGVLGPHPPQQAQQQPRPSGQQHTQQHALITAQQHALATAQQHALAIAQHHQAPAPQPALAALGATGIPTGYAYGTQQPYPYAPYQAMYGAPTGYAASQPFFWDQNALANAFSTITLSPPPTHEWVMYDFEFRICAPGT